MNYKNKLKGILIILIPMFVILYYFLNIYILQYLEANVRFLVEIGVITFITLFFVQIVCYYYREAINTEHLTGLKSRRKLMLDLDKLMKKGKPFALAYIDIDGLKSINDTYGHETGNQMLKAFASRIKSRKLKAYRIGGDEFAIIIEEYLKLDEKTAEILNIKTDSLTSPNYDKQIEFSIGLATYPYDAKSKHQLIKIADAAMYKDKQKKQLE